METGWDGGDRTIVPPNQVGYRGNIHAPAPSLYRSYRFTAPRTKQLPTAHQRHPYLHGPHLPAPDP
eukprot:3658829-Prorocentrum_lima.AAC.1